MVYKNVFENLLGLFPKDKFRLIIDMGKPSK